MTNSDSRLHDDWRSCEACNAAIVVSTEGNHISDVSDTTLASGEILPNSNFGFANEGPSWNQIHWIDREEQVVNSDDQLYPAFLTLCCRFFEETWTGDTLHGDFIPVAPYIYRVYFTRGCFNLNEMFFYAYIRRWNEDCDELDNNKRRDQEIRKARDSFMTQNALLTYIPQALKSYKLNKYFPMTLIADEMVIYGREISSFLQTLENALMYTAKHDNSQGRNFDWTLRSSLTHNIHLRTCVQGNRPLLAERFASVVSSLQICDRAEWRAYIQATSTAIAYSNDVENTSYAPFFRMTQRNYTELARHLSSGGWHSRKWTYQRLHAEIWQKAESMPTGETGLQWTFRVHPDLDAHGQETGTVRVVVLPLFEGQSWVSIKRISDALLPLFQKYDRALIDEEKKPFSVTLLV